MLSALVGLHCRRIWKIFFSLVGGGTQLPCLCQLVETLPTSSSFWETCHAVGVRCRRRIHMLWHA